MMDPKVLIAPDTFVHEWLPVTDEAYHADKTAVGSSSLALMLSSPKAFYQGHFVGLQQEETTDMHFGRVIHQALLEAEKFQSSCVVMPEFWGHTQKGEWTDNPNCKEVREKREAWLADIRPEQTVVTKEEMEQIGLMIQSARAHPQGEHVFARGVTERTGYYRDPKTGLRMKIKPDFYGHDFFMVTDFKTVASADQRLFGAKAFGPLRYDLRIWMYAYGISLIENRPMPEHLFFMAVEKKWPYESAVFFMTEEQKNQAKYDYEKATSRLLGCIESGLWPMRQAKMEPLWTPKFFIDNDVLDHEKELEAYDGQ